MIIRIDKLVTNWAPRETKASSYRLWAAIWKPIPLSSTNIQETLIRQVYTALEYAALGTEVNLVADDTDVLVLLMLHWKENMTDVFFHSEARKSLQMTALSCPWFGVKSWKSDCFASSFNSRLVWLRYIQLLLHLAMEKPHCWRSSKHPKSFRKFGQCYVTQMRHKKRSAKLACNCSWYCMVGSNRIHWMVYGTQNSWRWFHLPRRPLIPRSFRLRREQHISIVWGSTYMWSFGAIFQAVILLSIQSNGDGKYTARCICQSQPIWMLHQKVFWNSCDVDVSSRQRIPVEAIYVLAEDMDSNAWLLVETAEEKFVEIPSQSNLL